MKIGFNGDEGPRHTQRSLVGHSKNFAITTGITKRDYLVGSEALDQENYYDIFELVTSNQDINMRVNN